MYPNKVTDFWPLTIKNIWPMTCDFWPFDSYPWPGPVTCDFWAHGQVDLDSLTWLIFFEVRSQHLLTSKVKGQRSTDFYFFLKTPVQAIQALFYGQIIGVDRTADPSSFMDKLKNCWTSAVLWTLFSPPGAGVHKTADLSSFMDTFQPPLKI